MQENSFSDDEEGDKFFGELQLDDIVEMEDDQSQRRIQHNSNKENHEPEVICLEDDDDDVTCTTTNNKTTTTVEVSVPKISCVRKGGVTKQHPRVRFNPVVSPIPVPASAGSTPATVRTEKFSSDCEDEPPRKRFQFRRPGVRASPLVAGLKSTATECKRHEEWKTFLKWVGGQPKYKKPWFQAIPVTAVTFSQCKSIIMAAANRDKAHVVQLGNLLLSFLKEEKSILSVCDPAENNENNTGPVNCMHSLNDDIVILLEMVFEQLLSRPRSDGSQIPSANESDPKHLFLAVLEEYLRGNSKLSASRIPEILVKLYPEGFEVILKSAARTGRIELLLPLCKKSADNFIKVLHCFQTDGLEFKSEVDEDPDFQGPQPFSFSKLSSRFMEFLLSTFMDSVGNIPQFLQPLFIFDRTVAAQVGALEHESVILEGFHLIEDTFGECIAASNGSEQLVKYIISLMPHLLPMLKDEKFVKRIRYKTWPATYLALRNCRFQK